MKKVVRVAAVALMSVMLIFCLTACSSFNKVKKAFEKDGFTYSQETADYVKSLMTEFEEADVKVTPHLFTKKDGILNSAAVAVFEFKSSKELEKQLSESEMLKGFVKDSQKSELVNGNCVLLPPLSLDITHIIEVFKNA